MPTLPRMVDGPPAWVPGWLDRAARFALPQGPAAREEAWHQLVRGVIGTVTVFALVALLGLPTAAAGWVLLGFLQLAMPNLGGERSTRLTSMVLVGLAMCAAAWTGAVVAGNVLVLIPVAGLVAAAAAMAGVTTAQGATGSVHIIVMFLAATSLPCDYTAAFQLASWVGLGAVVAAVLGTFVLRDPVDTSLDRAISTTARALADALDAGRLRVGAPVDDLVAQVRASVADLTAGYARLRWPPLTGAAADRSRYAAFRGLQRASRQVSTLLRDTAAMTPPGDPNGEVAAVLRRTDQLVAVCADGLRTMAASWDVAPARGPASGGRAADRSDSDRHAPPGADVRTTSRLRRFATAPGVRAASLAANALAGTIRASFRRPAEPRERATSLIAYSRARSTSDLLEMVSRMVDVPLPRETAEPSAARGRVVHDTGGLGSPAQRLRYHLSPRSMIAQHAVRLGMAISVAFLTATVLADAGLIDPHTGYWIAATVVTVLRMNTGVSAKVSMHRVIGTVAGAAAAAGLFVLADGRPWVIPLCIVVLIPATLSLRLSPYPVFVGVVTATLLVLIQYGRPEVNLGDPRSRVINTLLGVAIALITVRVLLRVTAASSLRRDLADALDQLAGGLQQTRARLLDGDTRPLPAWLVEGTPLPPLIRARGTLVEYLLRGEDEGARRTHLVSAVFAADNARGTLTRLSALAYTPPGPGGEEARLTAVLEGPATVIAERLADTAHTLRAAAEGRPTTTPTWALDGGGDVVPEAWARMVDLPAPDVADRDHLELATEIGRRLRELETETDELARLAAMSEPTSPGSA